MVKCTKGHKKENFLSFWKNKTFLMHERFPHKIWVNCGNFFGDKFGFWIFVEVFCKVYGYFYRFKDVKVRMVGILWLYIQTDFRLEANMMNNFKIVSKWRRT